MAQWQQLLKLNLLQGGLAQLYERKFPRHIRHSLCFCIESQDWDSAAVDKNKAGACFRALLQYLEQQWNRFAQESNILHGPDFPGMKDYLLAHFRDEPRNLAIILSECLREEKKILASASPEQGCESAAVEHKLTELDNGVNELKQQTLELKKEIKSLEDMYENYDYLEKTWQSKEEQCVGLAQSHAAGRGECLNQANFILQKEQTVLLEIVNVLKRAEQTVAALTEVELPEWKRRQQMSCIGSPVDTSLDHLQKWFTTVAEVLLQVRQQLQKLQDHNKKYNGTDASSLLGAHEELTLSLLTLLLANALVVEKQPVMSSTPQRPLIVKTGVRFSATVRFLANLPEFKGLLKVKAVFDKDVEEILTINRLRQFRFLRDVTKVLDVDEPGGDLVAEFAHMSLKESRVKRESRVIVTEELHIVKFVTEFQFAGLGCNIEASSLPVVVVSSSNQMPAAWASVMWCNVLSSSEPRNLLLFLEPPPLAWQQLSQVLSWQFLSVGQRGLDENQLSMLRDRIVDAPEGLVHWDRFKNESTWTWIDGILDLIKRHLVDLWRDGHIMGFVSRKRTNVLLRAKPTGTFLLRFSESNKEGAITFSWVDHAKEPQLHAVDPYTKDDLSKMSMPDSICRYSVKEEGNPTRNPLLYLYPDIHRDAAFGLSGTNFSAQTNGYIGRTLVPTSVFPTPPSSPQLQMEVDPESSAEEPWRAQELFHHQLDVPGSPVWSPPAAPSTEVNFYDPCLNI
ncbi:signal transducer and activator of transcription 1-alpha/beta-like isoform X2 [Hippoglossus stenolepis]|uniref:signal transducer and activator of transcription 1-alpha/beta-like isoform X2 n=1 Tax=Hippoglossus stenolepis TaxID=195615 RepID=UPI00159C79A9|nr:signal transducer and activator of transcription 1-alpha/beta-like isoform X2 [Hippoglossus stenolepis]